MLLFSSGTLLGFGFVGSVRVPVGRSTPILPLQNSAEFFEAHGTILVEIRQSHQSHHVFLTGRITSKRRIFLFTVCTVCTANTQTRIFSLFGVCVCVRVCHHVLHHDIQPDHTAVQQYLLCCYCSRNSVCEYLRESRDTEHTSALGCIPAN